MSLADTTQHNIKSYRSPRLASRQQRKNYSACTYEKLKNPLNLQIWFVLTRKFKSLTRDTVCQHFSGGFT